MSNKKKIKKLLLEKYSNKRKVRIFIKHQLGWKFIATGEFDKDEWFKNFVPKRSVRKFNTVCFNFPVEDV